MALLLRVDIWFVMAGSWRWLLHRCQASEAASFSLDLHSSPKSLDVITVDLAPQPHPELLLQAGPRHIKSEVVCLGVALDGESGSRTRPTPTVPEMHMISRTSGIEAARNTLAGGRLGVSHDAPMPTAYMHPIGSAYPSTSFRKTTFNWSPSLLWDLQAFQHSSKP